MNNLFRKILLFPLAVLYGTAIRIRNILFDNGMLKSTYFSMPVINVGNLTVGGTGKTPHVEYLINLLEKQYNIAVLSRGYKRKSSGFNLVSESSAVSFAGDEPLQIKKKHENVTVAVDKDRVNGVKMLLAEKPSTEVILLDDAYQHRYIDAGFNILLIDYNRLITDDLLLPAGRLREHRSSVKRADIVLITKSPPDLSAINMRLIYKKLPLLQRQHLFYTSLSYDSPRYVVDQGITAPQMEEIKLKYPNVLLITGIAEPGPLINYLNSFDLQIDHLQYPDHHYYKENDLEKISERYNRLPDGKRCIITTEKDATRLRENINTVYFPDKMIFFLRINIVFLNEDSEAFNKFILGYVAKNKRNSKIS